MATTMLPAPALLPDVLPTERITASGMPAPALRARLRRISNTRSVLTVLGCLTQTFGVVAAAAWLNTWWAYVLAFVWMMRGHALLNILAHEAAHHLLFTRRRVNDAVGRWLLAYPTLQAMKAYRRAHAAHHRDELGPDEPDLGLYNGYPITRASLRRKLTRDLLGISAMKNLRALWNAARGGSSEAWQVIVTQLVMAAVCVAVGRPWVYVVWLASWMTLWKVSNRLRAIAEHAGMTRSADRRLTTHVIRQSWLARLWMVPYRTGWHLAHHADAGVPWRHLHQLHDELVSAGWIVPALEYPSYLALWRTLSSRPAAISG